MVELTLLFVRVNIYIAMAMFMFAGVVLVLSFFSFLDRESVLFLRLIGFERFYTNRCLLIVLSVEILVGVVVGVLMHIENAAPHVGIISVAMTGFAHHRYIKALSVKND